MSACAAFAKKAHQNTHLCVTHNKERSSHPFTCSSSEKVERFAPCCACRKNECFDVLRFSRPVKVSWEMVETN